MLNHEQVIVFVATTEPEKSKEFYQDILGLEFVADEPFALVFKVDGRMLRIFKIEEFAPPPHTVLGWNVADIEAKVDELASKGVEFSRFDGMEQDSRGIWVSPPGVKIAWFKDPIGNGLSLTQF